jgi:dTDP-glucose pyrophosphorylase
MAYKPTLLIIAAGMGSRYGGLKQIDPVGQNGEIIIDYSVHDAIQAGFKKIVFVIRHHFEDAFREKIGSKLEGVVETAYAFQELDCCLDGFPLPPEREKPWGTGHAILVAKDVIQEPFAVINADDYYGPNSFRIMRTQLEKMAAANEDEYTMVGYTLRNTLSEYGTVSRGICQCDPQSYLTGVNEATKIRKDQQRAVNEEEGNEMALTGDEIVSMNLWGFGADVFGHLQQQFNDFLQQHANEKKSELFIPAAVDTLIRDGVKKVKVLTTDDNWFGVTYPEDKAIAQESISKLIEQGVYPKILW